jgi:hypothetical protein
MLTYTLIPGLPKFKSVGCMSGVSYLSETFYLCAHVPRGVFALLNLFEEGLLR